MKRITTAIAVLLFGISAIASAQQTTSTRWDKLPLHTFTLDNGLKVIVAEEHSQPKIYGAVVVHAGSKNEDPSATGVAHYFEHIMFKGTDLIGTTDWNKEKPYLDSISDMYDRLQSAATPAQRNKIQRTINRLNIEASRYAIANETDAILQQMGCTGLNAGTTYDYTVYYNTLPANQLENWMEVYAERFRNPVYRLFQGELEAVYEERNLYANEAMYTFSRNMFTESFGEHPYSRDIIGLDEHLKSPQPSAMKRFYDKYYVANNMTLLLVGDVNPKEAHRLAEQYFSIWPKGKPVQEPTYTLPQFGSRVVKDVKQTPIKVGVMVFPGVKANHTDELALGIMQEVLAGSNGLLASIVNEGNLIAAEMLPLTLQDAGTNIILYVPKLVGQSHEKAENLLWAALDSVKQGKFSDRLLESIKMQRLVNRKRMMEDYGSIADLLLELEASGSDYNQWVADYERLERLTKADIMAVAAKYFDYDHCTIVRSSMGFPDKESAIKPAWDHLEGQNRGAQSDFAKRIAARRLAPIAPQQVDIHSAVRRVPLTPNCRMYAAPNPKNDLFSLTIAYHYGTLDDHRIAEAVEYFDAIGAEDMTAEAYNTELALLGGGVYLSADDDYCKLIIEGPEANMEAIVDLVCRKFANPRHDKQQLSNMVNNLKAAKQMAKNDASTWTTGLLNYVIHGEKSEYIDHSTAKEIRKMKGEDMMRLVENIFTRGGYVTYVGNTNPEVVARMLLNRSLVREETTNMPERVRPITVKAENTVFYTTNKSFIKSDIFFYMPSLPFNYDDDAAACAMFNEYMGGGMNSVFFQEIREFRSLGYSTYGYYSFDRLNRKPSAYIGYLGTQCDKTNDGIEAMRALMVDFPEREDKFAAARDYLVQVRNSQYIGFRQMPEQIRYWIEVEQQSEDPRPRLTTDIANLTYGRIKAFHRKYVAGKPMVIVVNGDTKKFDLKALEKYGTVKQVKFKEIFKF